MAKRGGYRANAGRPRGVKNEATIEREMEAQAERLKTRGTKSDLEVMLEIRDFWMGIAAKEQKESKDAEREPNLDLMIKATELAGAMAAKRAPFIHGKISNLRISDEPLDLTKLTDGELAILERLRAKALVDRYDQSGEGQTQH